LVVAIPGAILAAGRCAEVAVDQLLSPEVRERLEQQAPQIVSLFVLGSPLP